MNDKVLKEAERFRKECESYDLPRLAAEVLPDDVEQIRDIPYKEDGVDTHKLDIYYTSDLKEATAAYILIHGGAFVYGYKELDRNFGMRLARESGIQVFNINYRLMPEVGMNGMLSDIDSAIAFIKTNYNIDTLHTVGDSAGGYLAMVTAIRHDARSVGIICGCFTVKEKGFPGQLFKKEGEGELPKFYYDLMTRADDIRSRDVAVITGEEDYLRDENRRLAEKLDGDCVFYEAKSCGDRKMVHVYPMGHPEWPEGEHVIGIIASFARKSC